MPMKKLFETQRKLRSVIHDRFPELKEGDNLNWLRLALQVELGELANEHRGFKMWSEDQVPRLEGEVKCTSCDGTGDLNYEAVQEDAEGSGGHEYMDCEECDLSGVSGIKNPLLEEFADCLSFILEIGLEIEFEQLMPAESFIYYPANVHKYINVSETFTSFIFDAARLGNEENNVSYVAYLCSFLGFGEMLGFSMDQMIEAYYRKNEINRNRQKCGY